MRFFAGGRAFHYRIDRLNRWGGRFFFGGFFDGVVFGIEGNVGKLQGLEDALQFFVEFFAVCPDVFHIQVGNQIIVINEFDIVAVADFFERRFQRCSLRGLCRNNTRKNEQKNGNHQHLRPK
jgi:hypothetical protein